MGEQSGQQLELSRSVAKCDIVRTVCGQLMAAVVHPDDDALGHGGTGSGPDRENITTAAEAVASLPDGIVAMRLAAVQAALADMATALAGRERSRYAGFNAAHKVRPFSIYEGSGGASAFCPSGFLRHCRYQVLYAPQPLRCLLLHVPSVCASPHDTAYDST